MAKYTACIAYDAPYYATIEFEAATDAEAIEIAKARAKDCDGHYNSQIEMADNLRVVDVTREEDDEIIAEAIDV